MTQPYPGTLRYNPKALSWKSLTERECYLEGREFRQGRAAWSSKADPMLDQKLLFYTPNLELTPQIHSRFHTHSPLVLW